MKPQDVQELIVHCAATPPSMDIGFKEIDRWHRAKGWFGCGYHRIIRRDGTIEHGRPLDTPGAHVRGRNSKSIGICLVGGVNEDDPKIAEKNFTKAQWESLIEVLDELNSIFPHATIHGHNEFDKGKACPSFDVREWVEGGMPIFGIEMENNSIK